MKAQITAQMSEVDRLSNSGLYPILPIGDRKGQRDDPGRPPPGDPKEEKNTEQTTRRRPKPKTTNPPTRRRPARRNP